MKKLNNLIFKLAICLFTLSLPNVLMAQCSVTAGNDTTICQGTSLIRTAVIAPTGAQIQWYQQGNSTNILSTTTTLNVVPTIADTIYYIIKVSVSGTGACSAYDTIRVIVNPSPSISVQSNLTTCQESNQNITASYSPNNGIINWYLISNTTTSLHTGATFATPTATAGTFDYVVKIDSLSTCSNKDTIRVFVNPKPVANFTINVSCGRKVKFTSTTTTSSGTITNYQWNFGASGNNNTSTQQNPNHNYSNTPATYQVQLIVTNSFGCKDTITRSVTTNTSLIASLAGNNPSAQIYNGVPFFIKCSPSSTSYTFTFFNNSSTAASNTNTIINWGDGSANTTITNWETGATGQINHTYSVGSYDLTLYVNNGTCSDSAVYGVYIGNNPGGSISAPSTGTVGCTGSTFTFPFSGFSSNPPGTEYLIYVNDGTDTIRYTQDNLPSALVHTFDSTSCGTTSLGQENTFAIYYLISNPCRRTPGNIGGIVIHRKADADFIFTPYDSICQNTTITFTNTSIGALAVGSSGPCIPGNSVWDISPSTGWTILAGSSLGTDNSYPNEPNSWTSGTQNLQINFNLPGQYNVKLRTGNDECGKDSIIKTICVNPIPTAVFTLSPNTGCTPLRVNATGITNTPTCGSNTYKWTVSYAPTAGCTPNASDYAYVNGTNSSSQNPQFSFVSPGVYTIGLQTFSPKARCSSVVVTQTVTVKSKPIVTLSGIPATLCQNVAITPSATAICYIDAATTYAWAFSNATPSTSTQLNPGSVLFNAPGNQTVALTATNTCGPTTAQQIVNVLPVPTVTPKPDVAYCNGTAVPAIVFGGSSVANTTYNWTNNNTNTGIAASGSGSIPAFTATNTTNEPIISIITVTPIANNCPGTSDIFNITVNPTPTVTDPTDQIVCNGNTTTAVTFGGSAVAGTTYSWTNNTTSIGLAASGTGNIAAFTATNTTNAPVVATITVTATANNCPSVQQTFTITVNPTPTVNDPANQTVCNGNPISAINFSGNNVSGVVYNWTNNTPSINLAASGSGNIAVFNAANSTSSPVVATITVTPVANGCSGTPQTFTITVNPAPVVTFSPANQNICSGATSSLVTLNTTTTGVTVNFNWTATQPTGITGVATSGTSTIPTQTLTNTTNAPITISYQATGTISGGTPCPGSQFTYQITVHPKPNASATNQTICSNTATSIALNTTTTPATAVTYGWTPSINANVTGASASSGATIAQTLLNSASTPQNITYTITPTYTSGSLTCTGSTQTVIATVNPVPNVTQPSNIIVCNNTSTGAINFATTVTGTTYSWTNSNTTIGLLAPTGTGNISAFTGLNSGTSPTFTTIAVTPNFTNTSGPTCPGAPKSFTITVNPTPTVTTIGNVTICHNSSSSAISFSSTVTNTVFDWSNNNTAIGLGASGTGTIPVFTGTNAGTAPITATITVTPKFTNSAAATPVCSGTPITFTITINPRPTVTATPATQSICSGAQVNIALSSNISSGVTYNSVLTGSTNIGGATTTTSNPINQTLTNSSSTAQTVTYTVTPTYTNNNVGCDGPTTTSTVTVNPAPDVAQPNNVTFCNNTSSSVITFSGAVTGTNFAWTNSNTSIGLGASGTGNIPSFTTTNVGTTPITATIQVTPSLSSATGCSGVVKSFIITINPTPAATATPTTATICSGTTPSIALTSSITSTAGTTTYNWSPSTNLNITGASSSTGTPIAQTLNNTATTPQSITYSITPTYTNNLVACAGSPITATVTVNPVPTVNQPTSLVRCNNTTTGNISFSSTVTGTVYSWTNDNTNIGLAASGNGDINSFTVTNTTNAPIIANITVTPKYLLSGTTYCIGTPQTFTITVNPTPTVIMPSNIVICNGATTGLISFSSLVNGTTFPWTNSQTSIGLAASGTGNISAFNGINSTSSSVVATISVIPTNVNAGVTCTGATQTFTITVNPAPNVTFSPSSQTICSGQSSTVVTLGSSTSGVTYSWSSTSPATVTGATTSGTTGTIPAQTLINNSNIPQTVVYSAVASTGGAAACPGGSSSYNIIVNPKPVVLAQTLTICSADAFTLTLTNSAPPTIIPSGTTYTWTVATNTNVTGQSNQTTGTGTISQTLTNLSNTQQAVVYTITPTSGAAGSCVGSSFTLTVNVDPRPKITNITASVCSGSLLTVNIPANNPQTVILPLNTTYTWTFVDNPNITGESNESTGQTSITQTLTNTTNVPQNVVYTVTPKTGSCTGPTFTVTVTVNPAPYIPSQTAGTCSGIPFTVTLTNGNPTSATVIPAGTQYTWTVAPNADVTGESNQTTAQSSISQTLTNTSNINQSVLYTVTPVSGAAGSCAGTPFTLTVTLNTKPVIPAQTATTCSGIAFNIAPQNGVPNASTIVPNGTTYTWTVAPNSDVTGASNQTTPQTSIGQTLVNTTNTNQTVVYTVTPLIGTCAGATFTVTVTVTPAPFVPNQTATICSGAAFTITPTNAPTATIVPSGTTYTWTVVDNVNVSGDLNETTAQPSISQTLTNNTNVVQTVVYTVTPQSGSCTGATFSVTVTVNPKPVVPAQSQTICSGNAFTLTLTNNEPTTIIPLGTTYTWTVATNANVTGQSDQTASTGTISQTLTNSSNSQQAVVYTITPTSGAAGTCLGSPFTLTVNVDPRPKITPIIASVCSGLSLTVSIPANNPPTVILPANTTYTWTFADNVNVTGESNESTGQSTITQTLVNTTNVPQNVVYVVTPKTGNCDGPTFTVTVTVNPAPYIPSQTAVTCSGVLFSVTPSNGVPTSATVVPAGTQYTWTVAPNADVTGESNQTTAQSSISQTLTNTSNINQSVVYTVTPVSGAAGSCAGTQFTLTVTLNTKPVIPNQSVSTCSAIAFTVPLTNNPPTTILPSGTTYTWTVVDNPLVNGDLDETTPQNSIGQTLINTTNVTQTVVYTVTPLIGNCSGATFTVTVTVTPAPFVPNQTATICSGAAFTITPTNAPSTTIVPSGTTYTWTVVDNVNVSGDLNETTAQPSISQTLTNNTNVVQTVVYTVTPQSGSCTGLPFSVTVTVNPKPMVPAQTLTICSADAFALTLTNNEPTMIIPLGTTYTWTVATNANVTGQSNQTGLSTISQTLTNSSNSQQVVVYSITPISGAAGSCAGNPFTLTVNVDPRPKITDINASVCSGSLLTVSIPANNPPTVILPANTTYTWTFADNVNVTGESNESTGQSTITQTLVNTTNVPQNVVYVVTPKTGNCDGPTFTVTVTVNPAPYIPSQTAVTCSGVLFSLTPANGVPTAATVVPAGTQYTWTVVPNADVTGESNQTTAQSSISQTLTNTSNINQTVVYTVTPVSGAAGLCAGEPFTLTVTLNTKPVIPNQSVSTCSAIAFTVPLTNNPPTTILPLGTTYTWTVVDNPLVTGDEDQTTPVLNLSQTLTNTTNTPQIVQYNVIPGIGNCTGTPFALSVTINPAPIVPNQTDTICSGEAFSLPLLVNNPPSYIIPIGTAYTWTVVDNVSVSGDLNETNPQTSISQTLTNNTNVPQVVTYTVTPLFGNCVGNSFSVEVTVNPKPVIPNQNIVFCSGNLFTFNPTNNPPTVIIPNNTTYEWTVSNNTNITGQSSSTSPQSSINQTLTNNSNTPQVITYTITPTSGEQGNCIGQVVTITITINPAPVFPTMFDTICSGNTFDSIPRNNPPLFIVPAGTTYSWGVPNMPTGIGPDVTSGTSGGVATTSPQNQIFGTLTNTAYNPLNVTYSITPSSPNSTGSGCAGAPFNYVVTVNPLPVISNNPLSQSICNETSSNSITFTSFTDNSTYNWNTVGTTTITGQIATGLGNLPSMLLTNAGLAQDSVNYAITTTANACTGPATNYTIYVNPDANANFSYAVDTACWPFVLDVTNVSATTADSAYYWYATYTTNNTLITTLIGTGYDFPGYTIVLPDDSVMIRLITISKYGCKPDTLDHWFFTRYKPRPNFTFTYSPASGCGPNTVTFNNTTPYQVWFDYQWNFGVPPNPQTPVPNPTNSTLAQPGSVLYQSDQLDFMDATYNVLLTVSNVCETKDTTIPVIIRSLPKARFAPDQTNVCSNTLVTFTNTSLGMDVTYHWDFGDGTDTNTTNLDPVQHAYNVGDTATFYAVLTATNDCGIDVDTVVIRVTPSTIDLNWFIVQNSQFGCAPHRVEIRNVSTGGTQFVWNFNDPNSPANYVSSLNSEVIYHTYTTPGIYDISVRATNSCSDTSGVKQVRVIRTPITAFDIVNNNACPWTPVSFFNQTDTATNYTWNFGDPASGLNNTSILQNPSHVYTQPGVYVVTLTANLVDITGVSCPKEIRDTVYVVAPIAQISSNPTGCIKDTILFTPIVSSVLGLPPIQDTIWQINGVPYTVPAQEYPNFSHVFTLPGTYTITLIVGTITGCYDTVSTTITINTLPTISASADQRICLGQSVQLNAISNAANYQWTPLSGLSCYNCSNPIANPTTSTNYVVSTFNTFGCKNTDTVIITVIQPFDITVSPNDTICIGESATLTVSGASNYIWTPSATLSCSTCPNPVATPLITTTYTVVGTDNYRCFTDTGKVVVAVGKYPVVTLPAPQILSAGMLYPIIPQITNGPIRNYDWNPATNLSCDNCANPIAFIKKDVCYSLEAENIYGCKGSDTFCIRVFCENTQAFIPNTFTPDGDGINDIFMVRGTGIKTVKQFRVFNRWGELIFEKSNFPPNSIQYGWDGKVRGVPAIPDVFVYTAEVLCENDVPFTYKGNVTLIK